MTNTGDRNTGDRNTGHYNTGDYNTGYFNTTTPTTMSVFNGKIVDREKGYASLPGWLRSARPSHWVSASDMSEDEKEENPDWDTVGGFPRNRSMKEAYAKAWANSDQDVEAVENILGFDRKIWIEITGLDLWDGEEDDCSGREVVIDGKTYRLELKAD